MYYVLVHRSNRISQTHRSGDDQQSALDGHLQERDEAEQPHQADGIPFPQEHPSFEYRYVISIDTRLVPTS